MNKLFVENDVCKNESIGSLTREICMLMHQSRLIVNELACMSIINLLNPFISETDPYTNFPSMIVIISNGYPS